MVTEALSADPDAWELGVFAVLRVADDVVVVLEEDPHGPGTVRLAITTYDQAPARRRRVTAHIRRLLLQAGLSAIQWSGDVPDTPRHRRRGDAHLRLLSGPG